MRTKELLLMASGLVPAAGWTRPALQGSVTPHTMLPDTSINSSAPVPKLVYMKLVDDTWWTGGGIHGVQVL